MYQANTEGHGLPEVRVREWDMPPDRVVKSSQTTISSSLDHLAAAIGHMDKLGQSLEDKLTPVLSEPTPRAEVNLGANKSGPLGCQLSRHIEELAARVDNICSYIASITARCEL